MVHRKRSNDAVKSRSSLQSWPVGGRVIRLSIRQCVAHEFFKVSETITVSVGAAIWIEASRYFDEVRHTVVIGVERADRFRERVARALDGRAPGAKKLKRVELNRRVAEERDRSVV